MSSHARIVKIPKDDHLFHRDGYTGMIHSEYMATANQLGKICRNGNEKTIWQLERAEIVLLPYLFGNWRPTKDDF
jgi:hypothetical protein